MNLSESKGVTFESNRYGSDKKVQFETKYESNLEILNDNQEIFQLIYDTIDGEYDYQTFKETLAKKIETQQLREAATNKDRI